MEEKKKGGWGVRRLAGMSLAGGAAVAAAVVLSPSLHAWLVADDFLHVSYLRCIQSPLTFFFHPVFSDRLFRPLSMTVNFYLNRFFGLSPSVLHTTDLILHSLNVILVFLLALTLFEKQRAPDSPGHGASPAAETGRSGLMPAFAAALLFAVHPVAALTAAWFACRADLIAGGCALLSLLMIARWPGNSASLLLSSLFTLLALFAKETYLPLFAVGSVLAFCRRGSLPFRLHFRRAILTSLCLLNVTLFYLVWRLVVLHGLGGYEPPASTLSALLAQAGYHLPRVLCRTGRTLLAPHLPNDQALIFPLAVSAAILLLGAPAALRRERDTLLFSFGLILFSLVPFWNLSHMLVARHERLFYFPLVGFVLFAASLLAGLRQWWLRWPAAAAVMVAASGYGLIAFQEVDDWRAGAAQNRRLARAVANFLDAAGPDSHVRRVYVLGAPSDGYALDRMVKMEMKISPGSREVLLASGESFLWLCREEAHRSYLFDIPLSALPSRKEYLTAPEMILESVTPPDLLAAAFFDRSGRILFWRGSKLSDLTAALQERYRLRQLLQSEARQKPYFLPSFSFVKSPLPLQWEACEHLVVSEPRFYGEPYRFTALNSDPYLLSPPVRFAAMFATHLELEMRLPSRPYLPPGEDQACFSWLTSHQPFFSAEQTICFPIVADGEIHTYQVPLYHNIYWCRSAVVSRLRLDPISYPAFFELFRLEFIVL